MVAQVPHIRWYLSWIPVGIWLQLAEAVHLKARQSISNRIMVSEDMFKRHSEVRDSSM